MRKIMRFLYLNIYAFFILFCGIISVMIPLYKVSWWLIIPQIIISLFCLKQAVQLLSTWADKMAKYDLLMRRNSNEFHPISFKPFMNAPCGRLLTKAVLRDLGLRSRYRDLLVYREPLIVFMRKNCVPQKTRIYIAK